MESMDAVETTLRESIDRVKMFFPKGDPAFKLDSYLISWVGDVAPQLFNDV
jgi:hypothetical protein